MARRSRRATRASRLVRALISSALALTLLVLGFIVVNGELTQRGRVFNPTVALVNEDLAAEFNGATYTFGANFVDRVSKDSEYNWTVVSRPVAEKAYKDASVDAVIYLPRTFTQDILTLQDLQPTRATVEYKLRRQVDELADRQLEGKVTDIVHGFNRRVVALYYASVAGNIADADVYLRTAVGIHAALVATLTADVQEPLSKTVPSIQDFITASSNLKDINATTIRAQNTYTQTVTESLSRAGEAFESELPTVDEYAQRQRGIAQVNVTNANGGIAEQAASDGAFYGEQFDRARTQILCALSGADHAGAEEPCRSQDGSASVHLSGRLAALRQAMADYASRHSSSVGSLQESLLALRADLTQRIANLEALVAVFEPPAPPTDPVVPTDPVDPLPTDPTDPTDPVDPPLPPVPAIDPALLDTLKADIVALTATRDALRADGLPSPRFDAELAALDLWYASTLQAATNSSLTSNAVGGLTIEDWARYDAADPALYIDNSDTLRRRLSELLTRTAETNSTIAASGARVPDDSPLFEALLTRATGAFADARSVHSGVNGLLAEGDIDVGRNSDFARNFSTVLANTRAPGADTRAIHDFFSAPIAAEDVSPQRVVSPGGFDHNGVLVFAGGLLVGALVALLSRTFRRRATRG